MNICFTICSLSNSGGTERVSTLIANELEQRGYHVFFVSYVGDKEPYFSLNKDVKCYRILRNQWERKLRHFPRYVQFRYQRFLKKNHIGLVIDVDVLMAEISAEACSRTGAKLISWDHFNYTYMQGTVRKENALNLIKTYASQLVVLTKTDRRMFLENTDMKESFITQIYNPLTFESLAPITHHSKTVLALGRFMPQKGFDMLLKAWAIVESQMPEWKLEIIGDDGKDAAGLFPLKESLNLKNVSLLPATKDVVSKYKRASIYALSSRFEGFPMVLLEASAMSLPMVAFDCKTGPNEIIVDGDNGFLVEPGNLEQFAEKLIVLMKNDFLREEMGKNAYWRSKQFTMDKTIDKWVKMIESLV